jgi:hypothetical protein
MTAAMAVQAELVFEAREWTSRDWPRVLVHYDIEAAQGEFVKGKTELTGTDAEAVQHQVEVAEAYDDGSLKKARVSFYAALPKDGEYRFVLRNAESTGNAENTGSTVTASIHSTPSIPSL